MSPRLKTSLVTGGYIAALAIAFGVVGFYAAMTNGPDRQAAAGMYAFGDSLLFLAVFGMMATPSTGAALFFLRPISSFWHALSSTALVIAATGLAALFAFLATRHADSSSIGHASSTVATLRLFASALFAPAFLFAGLFAPIRTQRFALFAAAAIEAVAFVGVVLLLFLQ